MLRLSTVFVRTLREDPAEAELASHKLLIRAGYIRRAGSGLYSWLPLGLRVLAKIEAIVRQEMDAIGAQEVHFPELLPGEPYQATGRWTDYGPNLFRLRDRRDGDYLLAPTHEEMFTLLVKDLYSSYKDLPLCLYQIQTKYRDEARPRGGLLRARGFIMKDAYTFDIDDAGLEQAYNLQRGAYQRVFDRVGLKVAIVSAMSGAMGGSRSEEFLYPTPVGEDTFVRSAGGYAANIEAVRTVPPAPLPIEGQPAAHVEPTPGASTIAALVELANARYPRPDRPWQASDTLKNVVVVIVHPGGRRELVAIGVPGDREVDMARLAASLAPGEVEVAEEADFATHPELVRGYIGPSVLGDNAADDDDAASDSVSTQAAADVDDDAASGAASAQVADDDDAAGSAPPAAIRYFLDPRVVPGTRWITGANQPDQHVFDLVAGRDFLAAGQGQTPNLIEAAEVLAGDPAPDGSGPLEAARGIEVGHIFQLGRKYAKALGLQVLDENGKLVTVTMGSYGLGVTRLVASLAEENHDDKGLIWPFVVAPAQVHIVATGKDASVFEAAERLAADLTAAGVEVLYDDRPKVSPGVKFGDAELLGIPLIAVVGRGLAAGLIEVRDRRAGTSRDVPVADAAAILADAVAEGLADSVQ